MSLLPRLRRGFVDAVKLEKPSVGGTDLLFNVPVPPVGGESKRAVPFPVDRDVVRSFESDDKFALRRFCRVAAGVGFFEQGQAQLGDGGP